MIPISEALKIIERETFLLGAETVDLENSSGRVLAEDIFADMDLPPFDRSQMDGFAVRVEDVAKASKEHFVKLKIIGESVAGKGFNGKINAGQTVRIMTGARLPKGADAVQKKELARESADGKSVEIFEAVKPNQHFIVRASEIKKGEKVLEKGEIINARMTAILAAFGYAKIRVFKKPKVSILATGSEIVEISDVPQADQIRDSNSASLKSFAEEAGAIVKVLPRTKDDFENLRTQIAAIVGLNGESRIQNPESEILILSGGVSVGDYDFTKPALREIGAQIFFEKVALRPGKPTVFARLNDCLIFGLPGNPVSVAVTFYLFVRRAILQMQGAKDCELKCGFAILSEKIKGAKERDSYLPAKLNFQDAGKLSAAPLRWGGSSDFVSFAKADCLIFVPRDKIIEAGRIVEIIFLPR
ncbi:MAG: molybdopterin molybdotransferase MoeA [Pyrinomonadaceae bacterium]